MSDKSGIEDLQDSRHYLMTSGILGGWNEQYEICQTSVCKRRTQATSGTVIHKPRRRS